MRGIQNRAGGTNDGFLDNAFLYVQDDKPAPDLGALGPTITETSQNPAAHLALRFPDLYTDWEANKPHKILWDSYGNTQRSLVRIDLYQDGPNGPQFLLNIAASTLDTGSYSWIPANRGVN